MKAKNGPVKWKDSKKAAAPEFNLKKAIPVLIFSLAATAAIFYISITYSHKELNLKIKEVRIMETAPRAAGSKGKKNNEFLKRVENYDTSGRLTRKREYYAGGLVSADVKCFYDKMGRETKEVSVVYKS